MWSYNYSCSTEFYHHGIKGQKWGVRRFQNKDGSLTDAGRQKLKIQNNNNDSYIAKGSSIYRTANSDEKIDSNRKYVSLTKSDKESYSEMFDMLPIDDNKPVSDYEYTTIKRLKKAGQNTVLDLFMDEYGSKKLTEIEFESSDKKRVERILSNPTIKNMTVSDAIKLYKKYSSDSNYLYKSINYYTEDNVTTGQWLTQNVIARLSYNEFKYGKDSPIIKKLIDKGYDAMVDIEDANIYGDLSSATILLNPEKSIKLKKENKYSF